MRCKNCGWETQMEFQNVKDAVPNWNEQLLQTQEMKTSKWQRLQSISEPPLENLQVVIHLVNHKTPKRTMKQIAMNVFAIIVDTI